MKTVAVIGAGTMGSGIGYVCAEAGYETTVYDVSAKALAQAQVYHEGLMKRALEKGRLTQESADALCARMAYANDLGDVLRAADLIIEAVPEDIDLKKDFFQVAESLVRPDTILGSNTSSLPITEIASALTSVASRGRVIGIHFFNPAPVMKLVEIIKALDKEPVVVGDFPGFITTRVGLMLVSEAIFALQEGVAGRDDIDKAMKLGYNLPMGPLELGDLVGLDIVYHVLEALFENYKDARYRPPILLRKMVEAGRLGRKAGRGFYEYQ
jgi:3-hydroxybutyryl-CoA dehydrogenase